MTSILILRKIRNVFLITIILAFVSCNRTNKKSLNKYTIGMLNPETVNTFDPASAITNNAIILVNLMYDRLVWVDTLGNIHPGLARKWGSNPSATRWYVVIRTDHRFHKSNKLVTGEDVVESIERSVKTPSYGQTLMLPLLKGAEEFVKGKIDHIDGLYSHKDTVFFELKEPSKFFIFRLATTFFAPIENPHKKFSDPFDDRGSGPFELIKHDETKGVFVFYKNAGWTGDRYSHVDTIVVKLYKSPFSMVQDYKNGLLDIALIGLSNLTNATQIKGKKDLVKFYPSTTIYELFVNMENPVMKDARIRQIINNSINRKQIAKYFEGVQPLCIPVLYVTQSSNLCDKHNKERTYPKVKTAKIRLLFKPDNISKEIANLIKSQLQSSGINTVLEPEISNFYQKIIKGDFQIVLSYYGPFVPHPEPYLRIFLSTSIPVPNIMKYKNPDFDRAFILYQRTGDNKYLRKDLDILKRDLPVIPIFRVKQPVLVKAGVKYLIDGATLFHF